MKMNIIVVKYDAKWNEHFAEESDKIRKILGTALIEIYHIGSTSVKRLSAKPIIDVMPVVKNIENMDCFGSFLMF